MEIQRAYSEFTVKSADEHQFILEGYASTLTPDRSQDIVEPKGCLIRGKDLPFLWQHDTLQPIGRLTAKPDEKGIPIRVKLVNPDEATGTLRDRLSASWQSIRLGLVKGLSIGFQPIEYNYLKETGGYHFIEYELLEVSAVTIPCNAEASITNIKRFDAFSTRRKHQPVFLTGPRAVTKQQPADDDIYMRAKTPAQLKQLIASLERGDAKVVDAIRKGLLSAAREVLAEKQGRS